MSALSFALAGFLSLSSVGAEVFLHSTFQLHGFDPAILEALGYQSASVTYLKELGSLTTSQAVLRRDYEQLGCFPFNILVNGLVVESGFNCQTFFCVGYTKGPKICKNRDGQAFGGVVEISRRQTDPVGAKEKFFTSFLGSDQSAYMKGRISELAEVRCNPYYLMLFDSAVGEGYTCEEVGKYPYYSAKNKCLNDWRTQGGLQCTVELREDEFELRRLAIDRRGGGLSSSSSSSTGSSMSSVSSMTGASLSSSRFVSRTMTRAAVSFSDVLTGQYGYTAIMDLASRRIVQGYDDGSFKPYLRVNRAEFAKFLLAGLHPDQLLGEGNCFPDVGNMWYSQFVCAAKRLSWIAGYPDGKFHPAQAITKAEAMKIIIESLGVPLDSAAALPPGTADGQWYTPYVRKAMELKLILEPAFNPDSAVVRADASVWMYRSLKVLGR